MNEELIKLAQKKYARLKQKEEDLRYKKVIGKFVGAGIIGSNYARHYHGPVTVDDVLWASEIEPRLLEVLPAVILKKPNFLKKKNLPEDLENILYAIRRGRAKDPFRGVPVEKYMLWIDKIGHKGKTPSIIKTYRFNLDDLKTLAQLKEKYKTSEAEIIRSAIKFYLTKKQAYASD